MASLGSSRPLSIGSLCTGYGGLDMAVQRVFGGVLAWVADNDPGAARILARRYPQVPNLGDITATRWEDVPQVDIVSGGYPCQPFSTAGKRKGTADARHIWPHIARALGVLRPRYAVFENVAGHLSLGLDTVLSDLAALGFDADWICVRASDMGATHGRNRLFLLAWPADAQGIGQREPADQTHPEPTGRDPRQVPGGGSLHAAADADGRGRQGHSQRDSEPVEGQPEDQSGLDSHGPGGRREAAADTEGDGRDQGRAEPAWQQGGSDAALGGAPDWGPYEPAIRRWQEVLGRPAPRPTDAVGRLNPAFVEWLMGLPTGHVTDVPGLSRTAQLKALGNGVVPRQAEAALHILTTRTEPRTTSDPAPTAA